MSAFLAGISKTWPLIRVGACVLATLPLRLILVVIPSRQRSSETRDALPFESRYIESGVSELAKSLKLPLLFLVGVGLIVWLASEFDKPFVRTSPNCM